MKHNNIIFSLSLCLFFYYAECGHYWSIMNPSGQQCINAPYPPIANMGGCGDQWMEIDRSHSGLETDYFAFKDTSGNCLGFAPHFSLSSVLSSITTFSFPNVFKAVSVPSDACSAYKNWFFNHWHRNPAISNSYIFQLCYHLRAPGLQDPRNTIPGFNEIISAAYHIGLLPHHWDKICLRSDSMMLQMMGIDDNDLSKYYQSTGPTPNVKQTSYSIFDADNYIYWLFGVIAFLLVVNICCYLKLVLNRCQKLKATKYDKVSTFSETDTE